MAQKAVIPFMRTAYNYDRNEASNETALVCDDPSLTQQQFAEESDINFIAERYGLTGEMPQVLNMPQYGDFSGVFDFQSAQNAVVNAREQFMTLPAKMRARFDNDPQRLLQFLGDEENRKEAEFLGLVNKKEEHEPGREESTFSTDKEQKGATRPKGAVREDKEPREPRSEAPKGD